MDRRRNNIDELASRRQVIEMGVKDIVKVMPADHDTTEEANGIIKAILYIIFASMATTAIIMFFW